MMKHKTQHIAIKKAHVDNGILPLVNFLNDFDGITTVWSCEGDSKTKGARNLPYVDFYAEDFESVLFLLKEMEGSPCEVTIRYNHESFISMRFAIHFEYKEHLNMMIKWIKECWVKEHWSNK